LIRMIDGEPSSSPAGIIDAGHPPLDAMHRKLMQFLEQVKVFDVIRPGRRIDVPVESVGFSVMCKRELLTTGSAGLI
jgi:hypothetical protein